MDNYKKVKKMLCKDGKYRRFQRAIYKLYPEQSKCLECNTKLGYGSLEEQIARWRKHKC